MVSNVIALASRLPDEELLAAARRGEEEACAALFLRHNAMLNRLAVRLLGRHADVDDLVQESFVQALSSIKRLPDADATGSWLATVMVRTAHKILRRQRLMTRLGLRRYNEIDVDQFVSPNAPTEAVVELRMLYSAFERMPAQERIALMLKRVQGCNVDEIGALMGLSRATVNRRLSAAESRLRDWVRPRGES